MSQPTLVLKPLPLLNEAQAVAKVWGELPPDHTTAQVMLALALAFQQGRRWGHYEMNRAVLTDTVETAGLRVAS